jgi:hypothetical protein
MAQLGGDMSDTTLSPTATLRYVGVADWWGFHVWIEEGASRRTLPYRGEAALASFAWGAPAWAHASSHARSSSTPPDRPRSQSVTAAP